MENCSTPDKNPDTEQGVKTSLRVTVQHTPERFFTLEAVHEHDFTCARETQPPLHATLDDVKKRRRNTARPEPPKKDLLPNQPLIELTEYNIKNW